MKQTKKQWLILAAVMSVFSAVMPTSCKDDDNVSVVADNKPWTISADDNGDYVGTLERQRRLRRHPRQLPPLRALPDRQRD